MNELMELVDEDTAVGINEKAPKAAQPQAQN